MVTSEQVFAFIENEMKSSNTDEIVEALGVVARILEAETHAVLVHEQIEVAKNAGLGGFGVPGAPLPAAN